MWLTVSEVSFASEIVGAMEMEREASEEGGIVIIGG